MISFELNGDSKIVEKGILLPNVLGYMDISGVLKQLKLKVYINGKRCYKKIELTENGWKFVRPLKLTKNDIVKYTWIMDLKER